jgi:hypothetical protein
VGLALSVGESKCVWLTTDTTTTRRCQFPWLSAHTHSLNPHLASGIQQGVQLPGKSIIGRCFYDAQSGALCQRRTATGQHPVATTGSMRKHAARAGCARELS